MIIILSVITVIGLPKFYFINSQSTISALRKIKAYAYNAITDTNAKYILRNVETDCFTYIDNIYVCRGYPTAHSDNVIRAFSVDDAPNTIAETLDTSQSDGDFYNAINRSNDDIEQKK